jgi:ketosteroid isomerase-like protein
MRSLAPTLAALAALLAVGCAPKRIPGTEIRDTPDTRAVVAAIDAYRQAAERRDANAVMALVSTRYFDDAGTPDPRDDLDYDGLRRKLLQDYPKITALRLDIAVRKIDVEGDRAAAYVYYDERYTIATKNGEVPKQASDQNRLLLVREGEAWRFVSGL